LTEKVGDIPQQRLTSSENTAIIAALYAAEAREKQLARKVVGLQVAITLVTAGIVYSLPSTSQLAIAVLSGGLVSVINGALLAWRMSRTALHTDQDGAHLDDAYIQLRLMYFYAAERFMAVAVLLGLCMAALKLSPPAVLGGFVMGQAVLLAAHLFLSRFKTEIVTKNV